MLIILGSDTSDFTVEREFPVFTSIIDSVNINWFVDWSLANKYNLIVDPTVPEAKVNILGTVNAASIGADIIDPFCKINSNWELTGNDPMRQENRKLTKTSRKEILNCDVRIISMVERVGEFTQ